jgi:hypothetical protein
MSTYFTPVGTLPELTRAKGSDINARESAVNSGFAALEAAVAVTDGSGSIVFGTNVANADVNSTRVRKSNVIVILYCFIEATGTPGGTFLTLPVGYRPSGSDISGIPAVMFDSSAAVFIPASITIFSNGTIFGYGIGSGGNVSFASGDTLSFNASFFTS